MSNPIDNPRPLFYRLFVGTISLSAFVFEIFSDKYNYVMASSMTIYYNSKSALLRLYRIWHGFAILPRDAGRAITMATSESSDCDVEVLKMTLIDL